MTQPMTHQQPFETGGPFMTQDQTYAPAPHTRMNRFDKMEFINETTVIEQKTLVEEMVSWMSEEQFSDFYEHFCSCWDICRSQEELNQRYGE